MKINRLNIKVQLIFEAVDALNDNRLRTYLSLLGVAIGIAAIIVISSVATSGRTAIYSELETFGLRTFWIFRQHATDDKLEKDMSGTGINEYDYRMVLKKHIDSVEKISPVIDSGLSNTDVSKHGRSLKIRLQGVNEEYDVINGDQLLEGRFLSTRDILDHANVAVIGSTVRERLFPDADNILGQKLSIGENWFVVIGLLKEKSRDLINSIGAGNNETGARVLIPYSTRQQNIGKSDYVSYLQGQASDLNSADLALSSVIDILKNQHNNFFNYKGESMSSYIKTANRILNGVTLIGIVSATVSLIVGGLAIMNIMTTSVIERTNEIGLRKAIGSSAANIKLQFLIESILISLLGGILGVFAGIILINLISSFSTLHIDLSVNGLVLAFLSSILIGILSGYYPALKASKLIPVEALRFA